jgi:hypothetical protein
VSARAAAAAASALRRPNHHGVVGLEHEHRAVEQPLIARQRDRDLRSALRRRTEAMPGYIGGGHRQETDRPVMFQLVNPLGKRRIKAASEHLLDPQHRPLPLKLILHQRRFAPRSAKRPGRGIAAI